MYDDRPWWEIGERAFDPEFWVEQTLELQKRNSVISLADRRRLKSGKPMLFVQPDRAEQARQIAEEIARPGFWRYAEAHAQALERVYGKEEGNA